MQIKETGIQGLVEIIPSIFHDDRGWFFESYKEEILKKHGLPTHFPQENMSFSKKGVIRGMHFQRAPYQQGKLVSVTKGRVLDIAIDLRRDSPTFRGIYYCELDSKKHNMLMIPEGFAHGFAALEDDTYFQYKCTNVYSKAHEAGIVWNDPDLKIEWPVSSPLVSEKDRQLPKFSELLINSVI
jgi:dTDP-4-dehydrorhamnose 3,5-epimerase